MDIDKLIDKKIDGILDKMEKDFIDITNEINDIYFKEANKMYDRYMAQYYKYQTKSYVRHWEGRPGTCKGANLFYGKRFKIHRGKDPYFELEVDSSKMADDYQHDSAFDVLTQIMAGANIIYGSQEYQVWERDFGNPKTGWTGEYNSRYFKFTGTLEEAFYELINTYDKKIYPLFKTRWKKRGWII